MFASLDLNVNVLCWLTWNFVAMPYTPVKFRTMHLFVSMRCVLFGQWCLQSSFCYMSYFYHFRKITMDISVCDCHFLFKCGSRNVQQRAWHGVTLERVFFVCFGALLCEQSPTELTFTIEDMLNTVVSNIWPRNSPQIINTSTILKAIHL